MSWLVKRKHYNGGESVIACEEFKSTANNIADNMNFDYQTDAYYVEEYASEKLNWPSNAKVNAIMESLR